MFESLGAMMVALMLGSMAGTMEVACPTDLQQSSVSMFSKNAVIKEAEKYDMPVDEMLDVYYKAKEEAKTKAEETIPAGTTCEEYLNKVTENFEALGKEFEKQRIIQEKEREKEQEQRKKRNEEIRKKNEEAKKERDKAMQDVLKDLENQLESNLEMNYDSLKPRSLD